MSNKNSIISRVISRISDEVDGDSVLLVEENLPNALKTVCKIVADAKPLGHEKLLLEQSVENVSIVQPTLYPFRTFLFSDFTYPFVVQSRFHNAVLVATTVAGNYFLQPVNSMNALRLAQAHNQGYYYIDAPNIFIALPPNVSAIDQIDVTHYIYATITQFPEELEDLLISELLKLVSNEFQKQQVEKNEV